MYLPEKGYKRLFVITFYLLIGIITIWFLLKYLSLVLVPFIASWVLAYYLQKPLSLFEKRLHLPRRLSAVLFILIAVSVASFLFFRLLSGIFSELTTINADTVSKSVISFFKSSEKVIEKYLPEKLVNAENLSSKLRDGMATALAELLTGAIEKIPSIITYLVAFIPRLIIISVIFLFSAYYLASDFTEINGFLLSQFNKKASAFMVEMKAIFFEIISKFIKAYLILYVITFFVMLLGLLLIGVKFAFIMAILIATVDLLPVLGSGTVLIPWSIISIFSKDYGMAIKLIVLYIVITFIHQMLQPRLIGGAVGLHPLASLLSIFTGYAVMGIFGMFLFPIVLIIAKTLSDRGKLHLWKTKNAP